MSVTHLQLDPDEQRVLGSLLEKQVTVPASYPLSLNALRSACNQTSSRDPVVDYDERVVEAVGRRLKDRGLLRIVWSDSGRRTLKYHQALDEHLQLDAAERALLTVLLLRGPQPPGELRSRTDRLHPFADRQAVEEVLARMAVRGLVREEPRRRGERDARWVHLLGDRPAAAVQTAPGEASGDRDTVLAHGADATGIDLAPEMVEQARLRFPGGSYDGGDLRRLMRPTSAPGWSAVLAWYSLIHLAPSGGWCLPCTPARGCATTPSGSTSRWTCTS